MRLHTADQPVVSELEERHIAEAQTDEAILKKMVEEFKGLSDLTKVTEMKEKLMALYFEQGEELLSPEQLHDPFEQALREDHLIPVCFCSAETGAGIAELLAVLARLAPNPAEGNPPPFLKGEGDAAERVAISPDPAKHVLAHVFKVEIDPYIGRLAVFRVPGEIVTQFLELPGGERFFSIARTVGAGGGSWDRPRVTRAIALACAAEHAPQTVYARQVDPKAVEATPIGVTCRLCNRPACTARAVPPVGREILDDDTRRITNRILDVLVLEHRRRAPARRRRARGRQGPLCVVLCP